MKREHGKTNLKPSRTVELAKGDGSIKLNHSTNNSTEHIIGDKSDCNAEKTIATTTTPISTLIAVLLEYLTAQFV